LLGLSYTWGGSDSDGDGVKDGRDACPNTPYGAMVDATGCPSDSDGDGVWDGLDQCPATPRGATVNSKGCPTDTDGDGVWDGLDACPKTPKGATVDARGCATDSDGDGVADGVDQCADTPTGAQVDATGCPMDTDGDGVWNGIDQCPNTPANTKVGPKGCPILFDKERDDLVLQGVNFEYNSAVLLPESKLVLDRVAGSLKAWPEIRVEVGGHTDSQGSDAYNRKLSARRAASVRDYLVSRGVAAEQLTSAGYGETQPIADNTTDTGRAKNRRVELRKL
ncbi:MAG: OmpA family protein, partial [Gemmatimonadetes bacterium]|nr:OmpA family protein [Gemmatimonadota bacterium]